MGGTLRTQEGVVLQALASAPQLPTCTSPAHCTQVSVVSPHCPGHWVMSGLRSWSFHPRPLLGFETPGGHPPEKASCDPRLAPQAPVMPWLVSFVVFSIIILFSVFALLEE